MSSIKNVVIITNIPNPYRIPLFNELNSLLAEKQYKLKVIFGASTYGRRQWNVALSDCKFEYEILNSNPTTASDSEKFVCTYSNLYKVLSREKPFVTIVIGFSLATTKLWIRSLVMRSPFLIWSGAVHRKNRPDSWVRRIQRRILVKRAKGFIAYGTKAKEYLISLGAPANKISIAINTADTHFFFSESQRIRKCNNFRKDKKKHLLYIGYITAGKRLDLLVKVIKKLLEKRKDFILQVIGDGPNTKNIKILSRELGVSNFIRFEGFKQKEELPYYLAQGDCFLFPSEYDIWGLVLVEAMASKLPCIASIYSGATRDLIQHGKTGFAMDFEKLDQVVDRINWILENPILSREIGQEASRFIENKVNLNQSAKGFIKAIESA